MTILNPKIDNGYITGIGFDMYNFERMTDENFKDVPKEIRDINNKANALQETKFLKNYYLLVPLKIKL